MVPFVILTKEAECLKGVLIRDNIEKVLYEDYVKPQFPNFAKDLEEAMAVSVDPDVDVFRVYLEEKLLIGIALLMPKHPILKDLDNFAEACLVLILDFK